MPFYWETPEGRNEFQIRLSSWYSATKMTRVDEETEELKNASVEDRLKNQEDETDRLGLRRPL